MRKLALVLGGGSGGQLREVGGGAAVDLGNRVGVVAQRGGAAAAVAEAGGGECLQGVPDDAGSNALQALSSVIDGSSSPGTRIPDRIASVSVSVTCCQAGRESRGLITRTGTLRCSMNGLPLHARSPQRFSSAYSLSRMGPRTFRPSWARGQA